MSIIYQVIFFAFIHTSLLIPGYIVATRSKLFAKYRGIELGISYLISIALYAALATCTYILKTPPVIAQIIFWMTFAASTLLFIYTKAYRTLVRERFPLICFVLASSLSLAFIGLNYSGGTKYIPDPQPRAENNYTVIDVKVLNVAQTNANDNYIPYRQAQFFVNRSDPARDSFIEEWGVHFFQRTPLMGAVVAQYFNAFNDKPPITYTWSQTGADPDNTFIKFQIIAQILNTLFFVPAFYLLWHLFNRKTAETALLFMVPSAFFLYNSFFTWPKSLVAFFILLSWLLIFSKQFTHLIVAGIASGLAYLTHDLAILYLGASFLLLLYQRRFRDSLILTGVSILFAAPWLATSMFGYKKPSSFILYPLSIHDIPQPAQRHAIIKEFFHTSPLRLLAIRLESIYYLLSPYQLIYSEGGQAIGRRLWALSIFSIPGAIGFGLIWPTLVGAVKHIRNLPFWILSVTPIVMCVLVIGWPKGLGALHFAEAVVVLFTGLGAWLLTTISKRRWIIAAYMFNVAQLTFFVIYSFGPSYHHWFGNLADITRIAYLILVLALCGLALILPSITLSIGKRRLGFTHNT